jgi:hypothetical protein
MLNRKFKYEEEVIDPILTIIREKQSYLTEIQNLPQLAKLGYMFNTLWYTGRICWDSDGILLDPSVKKAIKEYDWEDDDEANSPYQWTSCGNNPKDKIEECEAEDEDKENLIYDAWGMHIKEGRDIYPNYEEFKKIIKEGKPLTELEKKELKINKTFEDWVDIKLDPTYKYKSLYPDRRRVADYLLCVIGSGYGFNKDGFIIEEASGADQDKAMYGDWQNAKFEPSIESVVDRILNMPEVRETLNAAYERNSAILKKEEAKNKSWLDKFKDMAPGTFDDDLDIDEILAKLKGSKTGEKTEYKKPYQPYYPISSSSKIFLIGNKEAQTRERIYKIDQSYIDASIEICKDILNNEALEKSSNVEFAKEFLGNMGIEGYKHLAKSPEFDKYELLEQIRELFSDFTDEFGEESKANRSPKTWSIYLNDTATNSYADNNYYMTINLANDPSLPKGVSKSIDILKSQPFYSDLKNSLDRIKTLPEIKLVTFDYSNVPQHTTPSIGIGFFVNGIKHRIEEEKSAQDFIDQGFEVGGNYIILDIKNMKAIVRKPKPLGSSHPDNKKGKEYFSNALEFSFLDSNFNKIISFNLDERNFNSIHGAKPTGGLPLQIYDWVIQEHEDMKKSDPGYGFGKREGSKCLYVHDFLLWLKDHIGNLK